MVLPFVMPASTAASAATHGHAAHMAAAHAHLATAAGAAAGIHTLAYFVVMSVAAWIVYRRLGLRLLRQAWINMDWVWAGALVITGVVVLLKS
jgi:hypothetical protein